MSTAEEKVKIIIGADIEDFNGIGKKYDIQSASNIYEMCLECARNNFKNIYHKNNSITIDVLCTRYCSNKETSVMGITANYVPHFSPFYVPRYVKKDDYYYELVIE